MKRVNGLGLLRFGARPCVLGRPGRVGFGRRAERRAMECRMPGWLLGVPGRRRAAAVVEFAVVLPLLLVLLLGIIEFSWVFMVRQTLINAAREGCRVAVLRTASDNQVLARVSDVMEPLGFAEGEQWTMQMSEINEPVQTVTVSIPLQQVLITGGYVLTGDFDLSGECSMRKEGVISEDEDDEG